VPAAAADATKTLRVAYSIAETTFDPAFASDAASDGIIVNIFDTMLDYDYLARPVRLVPRALETMPTVEDGGKSYLCRIRKGIHFTADPAFKGKRRELTANDFAYGFKRILDPSVKSPWLWLIEGKLVGGDAARAEATRRGRFDYDAPIAGLEVVDRYTLRIRLTAPDLRFPYVLAVPNVAAQAREVVDAYGNALAMTTTIEAQFGARQMVHGFLLNNELTDFSFAPADAQGTIKIMYTDPLSGPFAQVGDQNLQQFKYIIDYINGRGGALGRKFELVSFDNKSQPSEALLALKAATDQNIPVVRPPEGSDIYLIARLWSWWPILELEKDKTYKLHMTSMDYNHGFSLQPTNINIQVVPGYEHVMKITPNQSGQFSIVCNEFCGINHHSMVGRLYVK